MLLVTPLSFVMYFLMHSLRGSLVWMGSRNRELARRMGRGKVTFPRFTRTFSRFAGSRYPNKWACSQANLCIALGSFILQDICFRGANEENEKCFLPAFYFVALTTDSNYLQVERILLLITHSCIIFILVRFFFGDAVALLRENYRFLYRHSYVSSINLIEFKFPEFDE